MKHKLFNLQSLMAVALCVIMSVALASCGNDDDEPEGDNLAKMVVGTWAQDGDDDIVVLESNGKGTCYGSEEDYRSGEIMCTLTWSINGEWFTMTDSWNDTNTCRVISASKNKIVWKDYQDDPKYADDEDAFGDYRVWTWERYTK